MSHNHFKNAYEKAKILHPFLKNFSDEELCHYPGKIKIMNDRYLARKTEIEAGRSEDEVTRI